MKTYIQVFLVGICLSGIPVISDAALDWQIRWDEMNSPQIAKVYIFNPESTNQTFMLEIGDVAKTTDADPNAPHLIVGQDVSLRLGPGDRKIFDIIVYQDIDPNRTYAAPNEQTYQLSTESYRILNQNYNSSSSERQYPVSIRAINPIPRTDVEEKQYTYRSGRGYWKITLMDHDHVAEHVIRTGSRMGALHASIQQAILFYTLGDMQLTSEALDVWETAFPELTQAAVTPTPAAGCTYFVTMLTSNLSHYSSSRSIMIGDVLGPKDNMLSSVVAAEDLTYNIPANTKDSPRLIKVFLMSKRGQPSSESPYVSIINHHAQIERVIRIGVAENHHACAIQDVIWYINNEVSSLSQGKALWERLEGVATPTPSPGNTACFGRSKTQGTTTWHTNATTWKNLMVLVGAVIPFSLIFRRKRHK